MAVETKIPPGKQIRNFLLVILGGVLAGLLVVMGLVTYYAPSYVIPAGNALVSPKVLDALWYNTTVAGKSTRFEFDRVEFFSFDEQEKKWVSKPLPISTYQQFYALVAGDKSDPDEKENLYGQSPESRILIYAKSATGVSEVFQEIQFAPDGDHYRVQLKENNDERDWAYYTHPGILKKAFE